MCIAKWKKPLWEDYILYDYISMTFWKSQNYSNIRKATAVKAACGSLLTCSPLNWWKKKNQPFKVCGNNPKDKQQRKKYQFQKKKFHDRSAREVRVCNIWVKPLSLSWIPGLPGGDVPPAPGSKGMELPAPSGLSSWRTHNSRISHPAHSTLSLRGSPGWVWWRDGDLFCSSPHLCKKVSTLRWGRQWETEGRWLDSSFPRNELYWQTCVEKFKPKSNLKDSGGRSERKRGGVGEVVGGGGVAFLVLTKRTAWAPEGMVWRTEQGRAAGWALLVSELDLRGNCYTEVMVRLGMFIEQCRFRGIGGSSQKYSRWL